MKPDYEQDNMKLYNADCMDVMMEYPDDYFDIAVVDPPYGIGQTWSKKRQDRFYHGGKLHAYKNDSIPSKKYFNELNRISKNQIIWGGNYYTKYLPATNSWIFWDKLHTDKSFMSHGELAWTSFTKALKIARYSWDGARKCENITKIHPHQKPVKLYNWIYAKYAEPGQKIIDTHLGSGSNTIAAHYSKMGEFVGIELDKEYFDASVKRIYNETRQLELF